MPQPTMMGPHVTAERLSDDMDLEAFRPAPGQDVGALFELAPFPAALWSGSEMSFAWQNRIFREFIALSGAHFDRLGMPTCGFLSDTSSAMRFQDVAYTGLPVSDPEYGYLTPSGDVTWWQLSFLPVPAHFGGPNDVLLTATEVTSAVTARKRNAYERDDLHGAMDRIGRTILSSLDTEEILQRSLVEATETFDADWGWIAELSDGAWTFRNVHGWPPEMVGLTFRSDEESLPKLAADASAVIAVGGREEATGKQTRLMQSYDIGAFLLVPLFTRGRVTAVMGFCWDVEMVFTSNHHELADKLAISLSLALENARLYAAEREISRQLQSAFFTVPANVPGISFGHLYRSATGGSRVGGDFYDVLELAPGRVGLLVGDVAGRGLGVAALTSVVKSAMRAEAMRALAPSPVLCATNDLMLREADSESFVSAFLGLLDAENGHLAYCLAGHPSPVLVRSGVAPVLLPDPQPVIGVREDYRYDTSETFLGIGDLLVMYTDGLTEARDPRGRFYGSDRLLECVAAHAQDAAEDIPEALFMDAFSFAEGDLRDDIAVLAMRRTGAPGAWDQARLQIEEIVA